MAHIHTGPGQHDMTASAFIIDISGPEPRLWLHWHRKTRGWLQFGGHIELNETPWQAVCHEIEEESGFDMDQLQILQPSKRMKARDIIVHPVPFTVFTHKFPGIDHYHSDMSLAFITTEQPRNKVAEHEEARKQLVTRAELLAIPAGTIAENTRDMGVFVFDTIFKEWEPVKTAVFER